MGRKTPLAVVLGGGGNGLGVVRSLGRAGVPSVVVSTRRDEATVSRFCRENVVSTLEGETLISELLRLGRKMRQKSVLICADDRPLKTISKHRNRLSADFHFQVPSQELLDDLTRKMPFFHRAQQGGFPLPPTILLRRHGDLDQLKDLRFPVCVKPNGRLSSYDACFQKAYCVATQEEARSLCERILDVTGEVIAQEWIVGPNEAICFCLCCMGAPRPVAFTGRKARSWPPQVGLTASCWAAPEVAEELEDLTIAFFQQAGVSSGLASMEFKQDARHKQFFMIEPTLGRADMQEEIATLCGINLCYLAYCDAAGLARPSLQPALTHAWRNEFTDFRAARALGVSCSYPRGYHVHNAYWRWDDPAPAYLAAARAVKNAASRTFGRRHPSTSSIVDR